MELTAIENLSFAELKARRAELVEALGGGDLASRYVQARTDAKQRDERAAEMAKERDALQSRVDALGQDVLAAKAMGESYAKALAVANERADKNAAAVGIAESRIAELEGIIETSKAKAAAIFGA